MLLPTSEISDLSSIGQSLVKYIVHVRTSNIDGAGTSGKVRLSLFGDARFEQLDLEMSLNHSKPFKRGCTDTFEFQLFSLGILRFATVMLQKTSNSSWHLQEIEVLDLGSLQLYLFGCGQWVAPGLDNSKAYLVSDSYDSTWVALRLKKPKQRSYECLQDLVLYKVCVRTSDMKGAGTDANVFISITGERNSVQSIELHYNGLRNDKFEVGSEDIFDLYFPPLGNIVSVKVMHDNFGGFGSAWHLKNVEITDTTAGKSYLFDCNQWLAKDEGPATIEKPYDSESNMLISLALEDPKVHMVKNIYK